ncbi:MAG: GerMN domain-containing protein [Peptococcaceae bacterium]|nr:GerMN domain-containing protein [Peptococcaceae bacterium]MDH7524195.1 GerMN domain-containing protein [Peptococcaceae bacterium]
MKKAALLLLIMMLFCTVLSGCFLTDKISALKQGFNKNQGKTGTDTLIPTVVIENPNAAAPVSGETRTVALYFTDKSGKLVMEERVIPKVVGIARATIEELIKGPTQAGLQPTLPASTKLLDINVKPDGLAIVDLSGDLIKDLPASADAEKLAVYSIVNTITQFPTVEKVELRIDGKRVSTLLGHVKIDQTLARNTSLIK